MPATLVTSYNEIGFTILPDALNAELKQDLVNYPGKQVIGYVTYNKNTREFKFVNANPEGLAESNQHWSLDIVKALPKCKSDDTWIVFNCPPHKTKEAYQHILTGESIHIHHWDTWSVEGINAKVAVVTSWEIF
jgi:hypothetical protein